MAPIPPTPDNNPALAHYIAKRQAKAGATVPSTPTVPATVPLRLSTQRAGPLYKLLRKDSLTRHRFFAWYDNVLNACLKQREIIIPRPYVKANYVKTLMRKDKTRTSHSMDLPMELRYTIPHLALQFDTETACRPAD
ncbi:hypothetical protein D6D04_07556 [Aureobasidium pullulans]|nr:hypothetical protein D6D04_07556 [Aureobasidium pullulans]